MGRVQMGDMRSGRVRAKRVSAKSVSMLSGLLRESREAAEALTNVTVAALDSAFDGLGNLAWWRLPCSQTNDRNLGARVELEGLLTRCGGRVLRHDVFGKLQVACTRI